MKALFLTRDIPYPATNGYKKRNFYLLKELSARKVDVTLFCENPVSDTSKEPDKEFLKKYCSEIRIIKTSKNNKIINAFLSFFSVLPASVKMRTSPAVKREIGRYVHENKVNIIICDSAYKSLNIPHNLKTYNILYEHNIESMIIRRYVENEKNIFKKIFAFIEYLKWESFQIRMWKRFDSCIACSSLDKRAMEEKSGNPNIFVINNGVDSSYFSNGPSVAERDVLIYTGEIGWHPNEDAVIYFVKRIFPLIKKNRPQLNFWIVGNNPSSRIRELARRDRSITVTGFVDDVRGFVDKASIYVVPLRIGSGTRLKILEALSMKKAVVTTSIGCEGLEVENNKHLLIKDKPEEFASEVLKILKDRNLRTYLGENGRSLVEEKYDWKIAFKEMDRILASAKS